MPEQVYTYGNPTEARPRAGTDGSRVISFFVFNTGVYLHAYAPATLADPVLLAARDRCVFFEHALSRTRPDSDISRAHAASPTPVVVSSETAELICLAQDYCKQSQGLFDITMGTVTSLWDFHTGVLPDKAALEQARLHVDWRHVCLGTAANSAPTLAIKDPPAILDLGGVAKGYIADNLARLLLQRGIERFVINLGGNVLVAGGRPANLTSNPPVQAGAPWHIGVVNPFDPACNRAIVDVADGSVVTSGVHERSFVRDGVFYHHILDPHTGMPVVSDIASVTIVAKRSLDCDGYSTTAFMLGAQKAIDFVEALSGIEALVVTNADEVFWTSGLRDCLTVIPTPTKE